MCTEAMRISELHYNLKKTPSYGQASLNQNVLRWHLTGCRTFHPTAGDAHSSDAPRGHPLGYIFLLGHKISLHTVHLQIMPRIFSNHSGLKLESMTKKKIHKYVEVKLHAPEQPMVQKRNFKKIKKYIETKMET